MRKLTIILLISLCGFIEAQAQQINQLIFSKINGSYPMHDGYAIKTMGFTFTLNANVDIPSPTLVYHQGDSVKLTLWNKSQGAPHTIHLHGLDVNQQNDGVPHLSFDVAHDEKGDYYFVAPHAGTYIYHCHVVSPLHVQGGMYGMIIVRPSDGSFTTWDNGYAYNSEHAWLLSEVDTLWHQDSFMNHTYDTITYQQQLPASYEPQYFLINGLSAQQLDSLGMPIHGSANEVIYLRLANIGNYANKIILPAALNARVVSSDGRPLPNEEITDTITVFPGERFGVLLEPTTEFQDSIHVEYVDLNNQEVHSIQQVPVDIVGFFGVNKLDLAKLDCQLYPNPTATTFFIDIHTQQPTTATVDIIALDGKVVDQFEGELTSGANQWTCATNDLTAGTYLVKIQTPKAYSIQKIIIKK